MCPHPPRGSGQTRGNRQALRALPSARFLPCGSQVSGSFLLLLGLFPICPATVPTKDTLLLLRAASALGRACPLRAAASR